MNSELQRWQELAALAATGALDGADAVEWERLVAAGLPRAAAGVAADFQDVLAGVAGALPRPMAPRPEVKQALLAKVEALKRGGSKTPVTGPAPTAEEAVSPFKFLPNAAATGWKPLRVAGAYAKLLHLDPTRGYAVVLGKLDPGAEYPSHPHEASEQIFILSGDLHVGETVLRAGDFHVAEAGSTHGVNWSQDGCVILAVLSAPDLMKQLA